MAQSVMLTPSMLPARPSPTLVPSPTARPSTLMCSARRSVTPRAAIMAVVPEVPVEPITVRFASATPVLFWISKMPPGSAPTSSVAQPWPRKRSDRAPSTTNGAPML